MKQRLLILITTVLLSSTMAQAATAQYMERWPAWAYHSGLGAEDGPPVASNALIPAGILGDGSRDYRYTGLWVGVGIAAGLLLTAPVTVCQLEGSSCSVGKFAKAALISVPILGITGALIGGLFPKHHPDGQDR